MGVTQNESRCELTVRNIGGIDQTEATFDSGVTILAGRNATNRTSLLQAIMAVLGSDEVSMKADTDEAYVEMNFGGRTYTRTLSRKNGAVQMDGEPFLEDSTLADLYAFLLGSNEARRAVVTEEDLRDIIMRPVDTDEIQSEIDRIVDQRRDITRELEELSDLKGELPSLEEKRTQIRQEIEETNAALQEVEADIEARDADVGESQEVQSAVEDKLDALRDTRSELEDVRYELETEQESLSSLEAEKREVDEAYEEMPETPDGRLEELESRLDTVRRKKQDLEQELNDIQSAISFNQERLEEGTETFTDTFGNDRDRSVTSELLPEETVTCWTCGTEVDTGQIETTIEALRGRSQEIVGGINDYEDELDDIKTQREELEERQSERERLERRRETLETEITGTEDRIEGLTDRRETLREEVEETEAAVEELESDAYEKILELHRQANQLEYDLGQHENELERVEKNIATIEERLSEEDELEGRREDLSDEITSLRTRIERIETSAIEKFNEHMESVLDLLGYENLERIWLERKETEVREGRRKVTKSVFELHVVRQTESGATYEDTVDNLSESERKVTGLIFALSGYLAHEVYETVPFMLLDSVEAIDADRIAMLVDYFEQFSDYLVVALLPEDAAPLEKDFSVLDAAAFN